MRSINLTRTTNTPLEALKAIRIIGSEPNRFNGHLIYRRVIYKDYDYLKGDIMDEQILNSIRNHFPESFLSLNTLALFDNQYDNFLTLTRGGATRQLTTYLYPIINYNGHIPPDLEGYVLNLNASFWLNEGDYRLNFFPREIIVNLPQADLKKLKDTIKSI